MKKIIIAFVLSVVSFAATASYTAIRSGNSSHTFSSNFGDGNNCPTIYVANVATTCRR